MSSMSKNSSTGYDSAYDSSRTDDNEDDDVDYRPDSSSIPSGRSRRRSGRRRRSSSLRMYSDGATSRTSYDETDRSPSRTTGYSNAEYTATGYGSRSERAVSSSYFAASGDDASYSRDGDEGDAGSGSRGGSGSGSYDNDDYSSGYGSLSYEDSALRSPRSSSLVSSSFASFYYDHPVVQKMWNTVTMLRRPIFFLAFSVGGGGLIHGIQAMMYSMAHRIPAMTRIDDKLLSLQLHQPQSLPQQPAPELPASSPLTLAEVSKLSTSSSAQSSAMTVTDTPPWRTHGYPEMPQWLCEARANLPGVVVRPVSWCLRQRGVPIRSEMNLPAAHAATPTAVATDVTLSLPATSPLDTPAAPATAATPPSLTHAATMRTASMPLTAATPLSAAAQTRAAPRLPNCPSCTFYPPDKASSPAPMIPAAVFVPFLTCLVLVAGRYIIARQNLANKLEVYGEGSAEALAGTEEVEEEDSRYDLSGSGTREEDSIGATAMSQSTSHERVGQANGSPDDGNDSNTKDDGSMDEDENGKEGVRRRGRVGEDNTVAASAAKDAPDSRATATTNRGTRPRRGEPQRQAADSLETSLAGSYPSMPRQDSRLSLPLLQDKLHPARQDSPVPPLPPLSQMRVTWTRQARGGDGAASSSHASPAAVPRPAQLAATEPGGRGTDTSSSSAATPERAGSASLRSSVPSSVHSSSRSVSTGYSSADGSSNTGSTTLDRRSYGAGPNSATRSSIYSGEPYRLRSNASSTSL